LGQTDDGLTDKISRNGRGDDRRGVSVYAGVTIFDFTQSFAGISMQLGVAGEQLAAKDGDPLCQVQRANEIAKFGLAEARRSILSLRSSAIEESGLTTTLRRLVEHSNVAGRLHL
jgi:signal transduction histidine kinase